MSIPPQEQSAGHNKSAVVPRYQPSQRPGNDNRRKVGQEMFWMETRTPVTLFIFRPTLNKLHIPRLFLSSAGEVGDRKG